ncbi:MAG: hypothetical protein PHF58_13550 [Methylotenera sp.]|nr:hypothetical protein [Methylotenera sp.]
MPKRAARIFLQVIDVRKEHLQNITELDARNEGCMGGHGAIPGYMYNSTPVEHFMSLWESIYGQGSWQANPEVWVAEFSIIEVRHD